MPKCKISYCDSTNLRTRGVCMKHYSWLGNAVKKGEYTWEDLEKLGVVEPRPKTKTSQARKLMESEIERRMQEYERKNGTQKK